MGVVVMGLLEPSWDNALLMEVTKINSEIFFLKSKSAIALLAGEKEAFEDAWEDFKFKDSVAKNWSQFKRHFDEALEMWIECGQSEIEDTWTYIEVIFKQ